MTGNSGREDWEKTAWFFLIPGTAPILLAVTGLIALGTALFKKLRRRALRT